MLHWFAGKQIRNVGVSLFTLKYQFYEGEGLILLLLLLPLM